MPERPVSRLREAAGIASGVLTLLGRRYSLTKAVTPLILMRSSTCRWKSLRYDIRCMFGVDTIRASVGLLGACAAGVATAGSGWHCIWRVDAAWSVLFVNESCYAVNLYVFVNLPLEEPSV